MIIYKNKSFLKMDLYPNTDWIGNADYILDDNNEKDAEIESKIIEFYPNFELVLNDDGSKIIDVVATSEPIDKVISQKKAELSEECEKAIVAGVDVGDAHYSLTIEDQANILALTPLAQAGNSVFYHQDGEMCREYTSDEFLAVVNTATVFKTLQTTYCNLLMRQVEAMTNAEEVRAVKYGVTELTGEFAERYEMIMASLVGDNGETNS